MAEFIEGGNRILIDIVDRAEVLVGSGPLRTCLSVEYTEVLNDAGAWSARFPANDPTTARIQLKKHFLDIYADGEKLCRGLAEKQSWELDNNGQQVLVISGRDLLAELDETTTDFLLMSGGLDPEPTLDSPAFIVNGYNSLVTGYSGSIYTWFCGPIPQTETYVYSKSAGESALSAFRRVAEQTGESFRIMAPANPDWPDRTLEWLQTATASSGVRAVGSAGEPIDAETNPYICFIQHLTERRDASRMITRIYPYGSGLGETRLDLVGTSRIAPVGFTYDAANNSITNDTALAYVGKLIGRHVNFKDIRPLFNTDADVLYAKDYLFDAALAYLQRNDDVDDTLEYDLDVLQLPAHVKVGMTLRVVWQDELYDIDADLVILAIRTSVGNDGQRTYTLTVATQNQWRFRETSNIVAQMEEGEIFAAHPQIDANSYWKHYKEIIGDDQIDHMAEVPFTLGAEVLTVCQTLFRYKVERALIGVKTYALAATDTAQNVAANTGGTDTASSGGPSTAQTQQPTGSPPSGGVSVAATAGTNTADTTGTAVTVTTTGATSLNDATPSTTAPNPDTMTDTNYLGLATATQPPVSWVDPTTHHHDIGTHTHDFDHTHTVNAHGHTILTEHGHSSASHTHPMLHDHNMPHTHTIAHTHGMNGHAHTITHTHASPQHVHALPALNVTFALERIAALNSYVMADLEYAVNGGGWVSLDTGIPVAGGYYEADITGSVQNPAGLKRPWQEDNLVQVRRKTAAGTGKTAQLRIELGIRVTVQSVVVYS